MRFDKFGAIISDDGRCIPVDTENADYVAALAAGIAPYMPSSDQINAAIDNSMPLAL